MPTKAQLKPQNFSLCSAMAIKHFDFFPPLNILKHNKEKQLFQNFSHEEEHYYRPFFPRNLLSLIY